MATQDFQERTGKSTISAQDFKQIVKGDIINYRLPPSMFPNNPLREWHGRVESVNQRGWAEVTVLDEGYVGLSEVVKSSEIVSIAKSATSQDLPS
jgi:hypothetical protein